MKMLRHVASTMVAAATLLCSANVLSQEFVLDSDQKKYSYAVGTRLAQQLMQQFGTPDSGIDMQALVEGIRDSVNPDALKMDMEEINTAITARQTAQLEEAVARSEAAIERGEEFRAANAAKSGVMSTESGLQYEVLTSGDAAAALPNEDSTVVVHYRGSLIDGTEFDSSYSRGVPATFPLNGIIPGWKEILQLMRPGDKWNIVIPPELAYGERGAGEQIGPNETLIFEIELLEIK